MCSEIPPRLREEVAQVRMQHIISPLQSLVCGALECLQLVLNDVIRRDFAWYPLSRAVPRKYLPRSYIFTGDGILVVEI